MRKRTPHARPSTYRQRSQYRSRRKKPFDEDKWEMCILNKILKICFGKTVLSESTKKEPVELRNELHYMCFQIQPNNSDFDASKVDLILQRYFRNILFDINSTLCNLLARYMRNDYYEASLNSFNLFCKWNTLLTTEEKNTIFKTWYNHFRCMKEPLNLNTVVNELRDQSMHKNIIFLEDFKQV